MQVKFNELIAKWPATLAIIIGVLGIIALYSYRPSDQPKVKQVISKKSTSQPALNVSHATPQTLSPNIISSNSPASSSPAGTLSTSGQGSNASLQSNINLSDPSVSSNPLVESLYTSSP